MRNITNSKLLFPGIVAIAAMAMLAVYVKGHHDGKAGNRLALIPEAQAAQADQTKVSPVKAQLDGKAYIPNTENLAPDEMRIIACGTGLPIMRPGSAAACFVVELGNGDKFIFDIGQFSASRISALQIPYDYLDKIFLSHLHGDHMGDLDAFFVGRQVGGGTTPLRVWGPTGDTPDMGTKYAVDGLLRMLKWDIATRNGYFPPESTTIEVTEFDWKGENQVIYQENGVTIRSWPAIHAINGAVSFSLEWNGLKFVFGGDNFPNDNFIKYAKDSDLIIHECFPTAFDLIEKMNFPPERAVVVAAQAHTPPPMFGKLMSKIKPRLAVAYHTWMDFDMKPNILAGIRHTYDGPVSLAEDYMVWNVTKDNIKAR